MSADGKKPPPFYCPACGKKHRADLGALVAHEGAHAKVTCHRCGVEMSLSMGSDGLPKCELRPSAVSGSHAHDPAMPQVVLAARSGGSMSRSPLPMHLAVAAVVAGVVSFLVVAFAGDGGASDPPAADPRVEALQAELTLLRSEMDAFVRAQAARQPASTDAAPWERLRAEQARLDQQLASHAAALEGLAGAGGGASAAALQKIESDVKGLNGRIEGNYQKGRELEGRLKKLEEGR